MLAGSHRNAWPDETGTGGRTNRNTHEATALPFHISSELFPTTEVDINGASATPIFS